MMMSVTVAEHFECTLYTLAVMANMYTHTHTHAVTHTTLKHSDTHAHIHTKVLECKRGCVERLQNPTATNCTTACVSCCMWMH